MRITYRTAAATIVSVLALTAMPAMSQKKPAPRTVPPATNVVAPAGVAGSTKIAYLPFERMILSDELRAAVARRDYKAISAILARLSVEISPGDGRTQYASGSQDEDCPAGTIKVTAGELPGNHRCVPLADLLMSFSAN